MKKTGFARRALAMLLVLVMTLQLLPLGVFAFGELSAADPGVKIDSLKQEDAINWPIKVYDYLSDGMLFEWNDTNTAGGTIINGHTSEGGTVVPYGGGYKPPVTALGMDFTYVDNTYNIAWNSSSVYSPMYHYGLGRGTAYSFTRVDAKDYSYPMHAHFTDGSGSNRNVMISQFDAAHSTAGDIRYMVVAYRASGVESKRFEISVTNNTGFSSYNRSATTLPDSTDWTYKVFDLKDINGTCTWVQYVWLSWYATTDTSTYGMASGAYCDITHVGYFSDLTEATTYGEEAVKFDKDPGEYLRHTASVTTTTTTVTPSARLDYIFSLNYRWKTQNAYPAMFYTDASNTADPNARYGMDFTTHSTDNGWKTNAYTSDTYWTWANGTTQYYKYTDPDYGEYTSTFVMDTIGVEERSESNGAQYVRLTTDGPSKILLSKFREDHSQVYESYVPLTSDINYMVLVYRTNGLDSSARFGLWAQGYEEATAASNHQSASNWRYAALTSTSDWTKVSSINQLALTETANDGKWQYMIVPLMDTISEKDSDMELITRTARTGMYLPTLADGKSLDLAYVAYFRAASAGVSDELAKAEEFGAAAVAYMNSAPTVSTGTGTKTLSSTRHWVGGGNKNFGMLYASGGGNWTTSATNSGGSNTADAYGYDTWMIGYRTNGYSTNGFNTVRKDPITGEKYTANYTTNSSYVFQQNVTGTTNKIYFISAGYGSDDGNTENGTYFDASVIDFDGYQLLETIMDGVMTAGLLEGSLETVVVNNAEYRVPVYRQETVEYIAYTLHHALRIPQRDASGNYILNYVTGTESTQYGGVDMNGDGKIGYINYDGDSRNGAELNEASVDLATALRYELGITFSMSTSVGTEPTMGTYAETLAKKNQLYGTFSNCRNAIETSMDAAYFLLNNLFISNSYNQKQDDYEYLTLSSATVSSNGREGTAYVIDAGFTQGKVADTYNAIFTDDGTNKSALNYSPYVADDGTLGDGTISMSGVTGKTLFNYSRNDTPDWTTRFPFLPITDADEGTPYAEQTNSYYWNDDAQRVYTAGSNSYTDRNFNYAMVSNGEFVYREEDALFFEFQGDDDVYLFINGELVLDIGGAHSITSVYIDVNDYVEAAEEAMEELADYGYYKDMTIEQFDEWITADQIVVYDAEGNPTGETVENNFNPSQITYFKRQHRLNLSDGQICQFDFYYMERHGWGANMRILTNMHITDPSLSVDKTAYQFDQEIEYGGVVDATSSLEYNFSLTNTGNTKLYNLTFSDPTIGITLDPDNGLTVNADKNGIYIMDGTGGTLEAKDLTAVVKGTDVSGNYIEVPITFPEEDGDGGQTALKNFLESLAADGTERGNDDAEVTKAGSGLWVDATVVIQDICYMLTPEQTNEGMLDNTVYLTATTKRNEDTPGNRTLRSDANHRIYTSGFPVHYQWAGHNIFMNLAHLLSEAKVEATVEGSQLNLYNQFFSSVNSMNEVYTQLCDKYGRVGGTYPYQTPFTDGAGNTGYLINYDKPGVYTFYLLMYMKKGNTSGKTYAASGVNAADITEGEYAIIRSQVYVADVEDSVYVLDYGLSTESLDVDGELFKNDFLFGPYGAIRAKLMGVTGTEPTFVDPVDLKTTGSTSVDYSRINFSAMDLDADNRVFTPDGIFKVNLAIDEGGKNIAYDSTTGEYTLTGVGTVTLKALVPTDGKWDTPYLYYWYDDGTAGPYWPGTPMTNDGAGLFEIDIPADVTNIIINNGSAALKTNDLKITAGLESTVTVKTDANNNVSATISTVVEHFKLHTKVPSTWSKVYLHYWRDDGTPVSDWPGVELTADSKDSDDYYTFDLPSDASYVIVNDGSTTTEVDGVSVKTFNQTGDLDIYAGKEVWIEVNDSVLNTNTAEDGIVTNYYDSTIKYTMTESYTVHASVPAGWKDKVYLYYWHSSSGTADMDWPGIEMTPGDFGWYTLEGIEADVVNMIINDGNDGDNHQTVDLTVTPGLETWISVNNVANSQGKCTANIAYGSESGSAGLTFTPTNFMDSDVNNLWLALTVHSTSFNPTALNQKIDIHDEVQMYKKVTVLPATVVYYEDDFAGISYNESSTNSFTYYGNGSGLMSQSINQEQVYGQDAAYQSADNNIYSGDRLTAVNVDTKEAIATFTFKGTGFELISRTDAVNSGTTVATVYNAAAYADYANGKTGKPTPVDKRTVITQFDQGNDGGAEALDQVPTIRITGLKYDEYTVELSGIPSYTYCGTPISSTVTTAATCLTGATLLRKCTSCAKTWTVTTPASGHRYVEKVVEATCTERGYTLHTCTTCGKAYADAEIAATGHSYVDGVCKNCGVSETEATPTENENGSGTTDCVHVYLSGICVFCEAEDSCEHTYKKVVTEPTCVNWGYTTYTCSKCGDSYVHDEVAALGHSYSGNSCSVCGEARVSQYHYEPIATDDSYLYIDGLRIYQPLGQTNDAYTDDENGATFMELRDLIVTGNVAVATLNANGLSVSSGTTTWTENLLGGDFSSNDFTSYVGSQVDSADSYLIQGPNNEVYMEGTASNSAIAFYVKETSGDNHELQIAVRALDYAKFYGADSSDLNVQLEYGVRVGNTFGWKNLSRVVSGTEQYYSIPYTECPKDTSGRYQIVIRAVNGEIDTPAMVSYSNLKLLGLEIEKVEGVGESTILYYLNGLLVEPTYYLTGTINGTEYGDGTATKDLYDLTFVNGELTVNFEKATSVGIRRDMAGETLMYLGQSALGSATSATLFCDDSSYKLSVPKGDVTFTLVQNDNGYLTLSYCAHTWDEGEVTEPNCTDLGVTTYTCTKCGHLKYEPIATNDEHSYSGGICTRCGAEEPKYYLVGTINGAEVAIEDSYLFVDGKLTVETTAEGSVYVQFADGTSYKLGTEPAEGATSGTLTKDGAYTLTLPGEEKLILTLEVNDDGTLSLSYKLPCVHDWDDGKVTTDPTCTEAGVKTYTCTKEDCGFTKTEAVAPTGHSYVDGYCTACGDEDPGYVMTVYFKNTAGWENVYVHAWTTTEGVDTIYTGNWPGTAMTPVEGEEGVYSLVISKHAANIIFNNGTDAQTDNKSIPTDGKNYYVNGTWYVYGDEIPTPDYYLIGYINGADVGNADDYQNTGDYKFVDGQVQLTVTTEYSYVGVKTGDNSVWYWTSEETTAETAYLITTGGEKMKVPAGDWTFTMSIDINGTLILTRTNNCEHSYEDAVTDPTCTTGGYTTHTCSKCGDSYTDNATAALGHSYVDGVCSVCGHVSTDVTYIYFVPNSNWNSASAWFAAYFFNDSTNTNTWVKLESCGDNIYKCIIPDGYPTVIFCRKNPAATALDWNDVWNQTNNLGIDLTNEGNCYTVADGEWSYGNGTWSTYTEETQSSETVQVTQTAMNSVIAVAETTSNTVFNAQSFALNLNSLRAQMAATIVVGDVDDGEVDDSVNGDDEPEITEAPVIKPVGASLAFKDEIYYNVFFKVSNPDGVEVEEMGLATWCTDVDGTVSNAEHVLTDVVLEGENYKVRTQPISAKNMGEELYFKVYLKLADGSYIYSDLLNYSAKTYATNKLNAADSSDSLKTLCVALMNYGAAAQEFFSYKTDDLMNADLTAEQQALVESYSADMMADLVEAEASKTQALTATGGYSNMYPSVNFGGAFGINYIFTPSKTVEGEMKLYVWTAEDYANAEALTLDNASQVLTMTNSGSGVYTARVTGIAAKNVGDTVYACGVYESDGVTYRTGVLSYSVGTYCQSMAERTDSVKSLAEATGVYTYYAKLHLLGE